MSRKKLAIFGALILFLVVLACNEHGLIPFEDAITVEKQDITTQFVTNQIDILWVIDNSGSMATEQSSLTTNFANFIQGLGEINTDFHMAVITTDMDPTHGDMGVMRTAPGVDGLDCADQTGPVLATENYLLTEGGLDLTRLSHDFACIATVGINGSGFESGLEAMRTALSDDLLGPGGANEGFRRENAWLAIIFVTDENDCSGYSQEWGNGVECEWSRDQLVPTQQYIDFLTSYPNTNEGQQIVMAGILGPDDGVRPVRGETPRPSCSVPEEGTVCSGCTDAQGEWTCVDSELICACEGEASSGFCASGEAYAGYRYEEVINAFGDRGVTANICRDSFGAALDQIQRVIRANLAVKCLRELPRTCENELDCPLGTSCMNPGDPTIGIQLCSDFDLEVDRRPTGGEWEQLLGPDDVTGDQEPDYIINYEAATCPTGIGIEFTAGNEPGPGSEFRIRYPIVLGGEEPEEE